MAEWMNVFAVWGGGKTITAVEETCCQREKNNSQTTSTAAATAAARIVYVSMEIRYGTLLLGSVRLWLNDVRAYTAADQ